ncbi:MAG: hypothetical protein AAFR38_06575 [Planctomycetota bacterium]
MKTPQRRANFVSSVYVWSVYAFIVALLLGIPGGALGIYMAGEAATNSEADGRQAAGVIAFAAVTMFIVGGIASSIGGILGQVLLYQGWKVVRSPVSGLSPTLVVLLCYVPLLNWFWVPIAFGLLPSRQAKLAAHESLEIAVKGRVATIIFGVAWVSVFVALFVPIESAVIMLPPLVAVLITAILVNGAVAKNTVAIYEAYQARIDAMGGGADSNPGDPALGFAAVPA